MTMPRLTLAVPVAALVLAGALLAPDAASAQVGLKAGLSSASISFSPEGGSPELTRMRRQTGLAGGLVVLLAGNRAGGLQIEALLVQKGARNLLRVDDSMRLTYLEIPALIHLDVVQHDPGAVYVVAGPSVGFNVQASYEDEGAAENIREDIRKTDVSLHVGGGVEHRNLVVEARYYWGLRRVFQDGDLEGAFRNHGLLVTAGVRFGR
jgi:hypothetical protein